MKKVVLIMALLFLSVNSFAGNSLDNSIMEKPMRFTWLTSCGETAVSYSYEPVSLEDYNAWGAEMEEFYCG